MKAQQLLRKIHVYSGIVLFLPLFIFAASGFMLNHRWGPWNNFERRIETVKDIAVSVPETGTALEKAEALLRELGVAGEIHLVTYEPEKDNMLVRTTRPGMWSEINLTLSTGKGTIKITDLNAWSLLNNLHTFTGLHSNLPEKKNWFWTKIWSIVIDATALVMLLLMGTGLYLWTRMKNERRTGLMILELAGAIVILIVWMVSKF